MSSNDTDRRAEYIAGLRAFADLVESDLTIPTPDFGVAGTDVWAHIHPYDYSGLSQDERFELVHDFADAHGVTVTEDYKGDRKAEKTFGPVRFYVCAYADEKPEANIVTRPRLRRAQPAAV